MKITQLMILVMCIAIAATAVVAVAEENMPKPEGEAFWTYINETNPYTQWDKWPGKDGMYPGTSPHGAFLKLYVNDIALKAVKENQPMPDGAIIVKENYAKDKEKLMAVTPMFLKKGYNPEGGDWFWAKYGPDGKIMASGKVDSCIQCHQTQKDWLFTETE